MSHRAGICLVGPLMITLGVALAGADDSGSTPPGHDPPGDAYIKPATQHESPPMLSGRGAFMSLQVNTSNSTGKNILGDAANEPSIAMDPRRPNWMVIGWRQFDTTQSNFRQAGRAWSHDGGRTWHNPGVLNPGVFRSDPVLDCNADGVFFYNSLANDPGWHCDVFRSTDGGVTFEPHVYAFGGDKQWMAIDTTFGIGHGNIYNAWDYLGCCGNDWFSRSLDEAASWESPIPIPSQPIWGVTTVGPDGSVYVAGRKNATNQEFVVARSNIMSDPENQIAFDDAVDVDLEGRLLFAIGNGPNPGGLNGQVWIAADHSDGPSHGNLYVLCSVRPDDNGDPMDVHFVRSIDGGDTWSAPVRVNDDPLGNGAWNWFGTMSVAPNGRIDVVWNDTRNDASATTSELYYSYSIDQGLSWATSVPVSAPFNSLIGWPNQNKLGDYYDMQSDLLGVNLAYAATHNGEQDVYFLRIGPYDCNGNGTDDAVDMSGGTSADCNGNDIPDECEFPRPCPGNLNADCVVGVDDLLTLLSVWGEETFGVHDVNGDGVVDVGDLLEMLAHWGPC